MKLWNAMRVTENFILGLHISLGKTDLQFFKYYIVNVGTTSQKSRDKRSLGEWFITLSGEHKKRVFESIVNYICLAMPR